MDVSQAVVDVNRTFFFPDVFEFVVFISNAERSFEGDENDGIVKMEDVVKGVVLVCVVERVDVQEDVPKRLLLRLSNVSGTSVDEYLLICIRVG